jgi:hypothetical protein
MQIQVKLAVHAVCCCDEIVLYTVSFDVWRTCVTDEQVLGLSREQAAEHARVESCSLLPLPPDALPVNRRLGARTVNLVLVASLTAG